MSYLYTKEQLFNEFKDVTVKDQSKKKKLLLTESNI